MDTKQESEIERQIEKAKRELSALGELRPGSLSTQYNVGVGAESGGEVEPKEKYTNRSPNPQPSAHRLTP
jgi:hypothetical protein